MILPIAYGVNDATVNVKLENHQPIQNQNKIVQAMGATSENYLAVLGANEMKLDNMEVVDSSKPETYKRLIHLNQERLPIIYYLNLLKIIG